MPPTNGRTETNSTGRKLTYKPHKFDHEIKPDAPVGEWEATILRGKVKPGQTQGGDPRLNINFRLDKAIEEENATHQGSEVTLRVIWFDEEDSSKRRGANMNKRRLFQLCDWAEVDRDVLPTTIESEDDFKDLIEALEGKKGTIWTTHRTREQDGEKITDVEVSFVKPGGGLLKGDSEDEEEEPEEKPAPKKTAASKTGSGLKKR